MMHGNGNVMMVLLSVCVAHGLMDAATAMIRDKQEGG